MYNLVWLCNIFDLGFTVISKTRQFKHIKSFNPLLHAALKPDDSS